MCMPFMWNFYKSEPDDLGDKLQAGDQWQLYLGPPELLEQMVLSVEHYVASIVPRRG